MGRGGVSRQHTVRAEDAHGNQVLITMAVTQDKLIAIRRATSGTVFLTPRTVSRVISHLRDLQAEAMQGETWRMN